MIRPRCLPWVLGPWCATLVATMPSLATLPDGRAFANHLEDQLLEGEIDAEDFLAWRLAPGALGGPGRGSAYVGLEAFLVERMGGTSELGALVVLELPLERFVQRPWAVVPAPYEPPAVAGFEVSDGAGGGWLGARVAEPAVAEPAQAPTPKRLIRGPVDEVPARAALAETTGPRV